MPPKRMSPTTQISLSDEDAWKLLTAIRGQKDYRGRIIGQKFRNSENAYYRGPMSNQNHPAWTPPLARYRLPIDDVLLEMMGRKRSPRIAEDRAGNSDILRTYGPFALARVHLDNAVLWAIDPHDGKEWVAERIKLLADIDTAAEILMGITGYPYQSCKPSPLPGLSLQIELARRFRERSGQSSDDGTEDSDSVDEWQQHFDQAIRSLQRLRHHIATDSSVVRLNAPNMGRPRAHWKEEFVDEIAELWRLLTLEDPSRSEDSFFGKLLYEAWRSLDDGMPDVSFARAIRNRA